MLDRALLLLRYQPLLLRAGVLLDVVQPLLRLVMLLLPVPGVPVLRRRSEPERVGLSLVRSRRSLPKRCQLEADSREGCRTAEQVIKKVTRRLRCRR